MAFAATVFNVLIASPSDVPHERSAIAKCIHDRNALHAKDTGKVLLPVMWESHSAPSMADRPQGVINSQLVQGCDMIIGAFWMRLGSPTGVAKSGTVEEIDFFRKNSKPVMLHFSKAPLEQDRLDMSQYQELQEYKKSLNNKGLIEEYSSIPELADKLLRQLTINIREMNVQTFVDQKAVKRAIKDSKSSNEVDPGNSLNDGKNKKFRMIEYSDRAIIVYGDTVKVKDKLKEMGGKRIKGSGGELGWCFSKKKQAAVAEFLGIANELSKQ